MNGDVRLLKTYLREVLTGFRSLNTVARDGVAGNVRLGDLVVRRGGSVLDDVEVEDDEEEEELVNKGIDRVPYTK